MMQRHLGPDELTASQAIEILGVSRWKFFEMVRAGEIARHHKAPYKRGYFKREEIVALRHQLDEQNGLSGD